MLYVLYNNVSYLIIYIIRKQEVNTNALKNSANRIIVFVA